MRVKAHQSLERTVDKAYWGKKFENDWERVEHLFKLYAQLTAPDLQPEKKGGDAGNEPNR